MLDDLKYLHEKDAQDALGVAEKQWQQLQEQYDIAPIEGEFHTVVVAGMGGSALSALITTSWPRVTVPFEIVRQYDIPTYVSANTLFIASSYSGNTEETIAAMQQAAERGARIIVVSAGGKMRDMAQEQGYLFVQLPAISQPRYATLASLRALVGILQAARVTDATAVTDLEQASDWLREQLQAWLPTVPQAENRAKTLALELIGRSVVVYAGPLMYPAAYKWKISINENAKQVAWVNQFPEFNHNEFLGWTKQPTEKPYAVVDIRSSLEHPRVQKRFTVTERLLSGVRPHPQVVEPYGDTLLQQLLWTIALGDFVSLYVALANGLNPTPVDLIETFKKSLDD